MTSAVRCKRESGIRTQRLRCGRTCRSRRAGKLGVHVRAGISDSLRQHGLGHYPPELPNYQWDEVRIYRQGTPVGRLIEAVLSVSANNDEVIRDLAGSDASANLVKIRELVRT